MCPTFFVSDIRLPEVGGYELIQRVRALSPYAGGSVLTVRVDGVCSTRRSDQSSVSRVKRTWLSRWSRTTCSPPSQSFAEVAKARRHDGNGLTGQTANGPTSDLAYEGELASTNGELLLGLGLRRSPLDPHGTALAQTYPARVRGLSMPAHSCWRSPNREVTH